GSAVEQSAGRTGLLDQATRDVECYFHLCVSFALCSWVVSQLRRKTLRRSGWHRLCPQRPHLSPPRFRSFSGTTVPSLNYLFDARTARSEKPAHGWIQAEAGLLLLRGSPRILALSTKGRHSDRRKERQETTPR